MTQRIVSVGDDFTLPPSVKAADENLPDRLKPEELKANYGSRRMVGAEVYEDFSAYPDGPITKTRTGLDWVSSPTTGDRAMVIEGGMLTFGSAAVQGGYANVKLSAPVTKIGGRFVFDPAASNTGLAVFYIGSNNMVAGGGVPAGPLHFWVSPTGWSIDAFPTTGGALVNIGIGTWDTPLTADGTTVYTAEAVLDQVNGIAYLTMPDGRTIKYTSPHFKIKGEYCFFEPFRDDATRNRAKFTAAWASTQNAADLTGEQRRAYTAVSGGSTARMIKTPTDTNTTLDSSFKIVDTMNVVVPVSKKLFVVAREYVEVVGSSLLAQIDAGGNPKSISITNVFADGTTLSGTVTATGLLDLGDFTPGTTATINVRLYKGASGSAVHRVNAGAHQRQAIIATPVGGAV